MSTPLQPEKRKRARANTLLSEDLPTRWQPPAASDQFREPAEQSTEQSQAHIRPGADVTHEPKDSPDKMLIKFLRSNETYEVEQSTDPQDPRRTSQGLLREILADKRWTRRMVEDFYKAINPSLGGIGPCLTPYPFHRALFLVLLNALEDQEEVATNKDLQTTEDGGVNQFIKAH